jgi:hypothetical protein
LSIYMCWNEHISMNTFLFSCFALVFIYITNTYSKYKTPLFDHPLFYVFAFLVASMQLLEYFLWRNLHDKKWNTLLSKAGLLLLFSQLFVLMLIVENPLFRYSLLIFLFLGSFVLYVYSQRHPIVFKTREAGGHLSWDWIVFPGISPWMNLCILTIGLLLYFIPFFLIKGNQNSKMQLILVSIFLYLFCYLVGKKDHTYGSLWCWAINLFFLYFIVDILLVQPFYEYNGLC